MKTIITLLAFVFVGSIIYADRDTVELDAERLKVIIIRGVESDTAVVMSGCDTIAVNPLSYPKSESRFQVNVLILIIVVVLIAILVLFS